jgi:hypothetical protein
MDYATAPFECLYGAEYIEATYTQWLRQELFEESANTRGSGDVADMGQSSRVPGGLLTGSTGSMICLRPVGLRDITYSVRRLSKS